MKTHNVNAKNASSLLLPLRGSSFHENDRLSTVAAEHFKSLSRHSSPTEDREGREEVVGVVSSPSRDDWHANGSRFVFQSPRIQRGIRAAPHGEAGSCGPSSVSPRVRTAADKTRVQRFSVECRF